MVILVSIEMRPRSSRFCTDIKASTVDLQSENKTKMILLYDIFVLNDGAKIIGKRRAVAKANGTRPTQ